MLRKGANQLQLFAGLGCKRFVICYDADGPDPTARQQEVLDRIITPSGLPRSNCLALVPVQEIEAWILADIHQAAPHVIRAWHPNEVRNPEGIPSPKEYLAQLSRGSNRKPRYVHTIHNVQVARHLHLDTVARKCKSFRHLVRFIVDSRQIQRPAEEFRGGRTRSPWPYTDARGVSVYLDQQLATASEWGQLTTFVQALDEQPKELTRLVEYGWAELEALLDELQALLTVGRPKARIRALLTALQQIAANREDARFLGLDDGTR
jgi:hypothetical protein